MAISPSSSTDSEPSSNNSTLPSLCTSPTVNNGNKSPPSLSPVNPAPSTSSTINSDDRSDSTVIHKNKYIQRKIIRRDYNYMYLPAYSPERNSTENFWSLIKVKMKKVFFAVSETMTTRIHAACEDTHPSELYAFADHSKGQISKCYKKIEV